MLLSLGEAGSVALCGEMKACVPAILQEAVDTTGAGDTFHGACLAYLLEHQFLEDVTEERLRGMLQFANAAASIVTTRKGALSVMPDRDEILRLMQANT